MVTAVCCVCVVCISGSLNVYRIAEADNPTTAAGVAASLAQSSPPPSPAPSPPPLCREPWDVLDGWWRGRRLALLLRDASLPVVWSSPGGALVSSSSRCRGASRMRSCMYAIHLSRSAVPGARNSNVRNVVPAFTCAPLAGARMNSLADRFERLHSKAWIG